MVSCFFVYLSIFIEWLLSPYSTIDLFIQLMTISQMHLAWFIGF